MANLSVNLPPQVRNPESQGLAQTLTQPTSNRLQWKDVRVGNPLQSEAQKLGLDVPPAKPDPKIEQLRQVMNKLQQFWSTQKGEN